MTGYKSPKMQGNKVPFSTRLSPQQHRLAAETSAKTGLSMAEYIGALIERDANLPNKLDSRDAPRLPIQQAS